MSGRKRRTGAQRARDQARRIGQEVVLARGALAWPREAVARRANVARSTLERIEAGDASVQLDVLCAATAAVGLDLVLQAYPGREPGLRDTGQLTLAKHLADLAHQGWQLALEVPCGEHGESADVVLFGAAVVMHVEIERSVVDFQAQFRRAIAKRKTLEVRESRPVRLVVAVEDTKRNRHAVVPHRDLIERALPAGSREVIAAIRRGLPLGRDGLLWLRRPRVE